MKRHAYALAIVSGFLYFLGFAGFGYWPLTFFCLVPFLFALERILELRNRIVAAVGFVFGFVTNAGGYHWMEPMLESFSGYGLGPSLLFSAIFFAYLAVQFMVFALIYAAMRRRRWPVALVTPALLLTIEYWFPLLFPTFLGSGLHDVPQLIQIADLGGPPLVSLVLVLSNVAIFETIRWLMGHRAFPKIMIGLAIGSLVSTIAYGTYRIDATEHMFENAPKITVAMVQVNMGIFEKRSEMREGHRRHLEQSYELEKRVKPDLIVWPESSYLEYSTREIQTSAKKAMGDLKTPILYGGLSIGRKDGKRKLYNSAFITTADAKIAGYYDKSYLLAFGEYMPFGETFPKLYEWSPESGQFTPGTRMVVLPLDQWRLAPLICYEDVLPAFTRKMVKATRPHLLVNLTNDAWFGDTQEPWIHLALAKFRAVEHHRYLVRSTNSGISAVVDPSGRVIASTNLLTRESVHADVGLLDTVTVFERFGVWPIWIATFACFLMIARRRST